MNHRRFLKDKKRIIIKIGTILLTHKNGIVNLPRLEKLARIAAELAKAGKEIIIVTSGAVGAGIGKMNLESKPRSLEEKQAFAAVGQAALMRMYDTFFSEYDQAIGQVLLTRDGIENPVRRTNARNTINCLLSMNVIPIINENDTVSTLEIDFGDNDMLSALVADLVRADLLIMLTNTNGVYTSDPEKNKDAQQVATVLKAGDDLKNVNAEGKSHFGSGGMQTKIEAAELCRQKNIDVVIAEGSNPEVIFSILEGKQEGTLFVSESTSLQIGNNQ